MTDDKPNEVRLTDDDILAAELYALEVAENRQLNLPPYVRGENCYVCGRGVPRWEFVRMYGGSDVCAYCEPPDEWVNPDEPDDYAIGRSIGGEIRCRGCGAQVWVCTPQLQHCPECWPELWADLDDDRLSIMQLIARLDDRYGVSR